MDIEEQIKMVASKIDHAVLNPSDGDIDVLRACSIARKYGVASLCVKPCHVILAASELQGSGVAVCTVVGFPHGANTTGIKYAEAMEALKNGATEIDMVMNIGKLKDENVSYLQTEIEFISRLVHQTKGGILKVIIETAILDEKQKMVACKVAEAAGADYVKTSTGFASRGATLEDITLMKSVLSEKIKIKASGGIKTFEQASSFINAGCHRIGTSKTESILSGQEADGEY